MHAGDRKKPGDYVPVTTPIYTASSFFYERMEQLDRVFGREEQGPSYARYDNPSSAALEELVTSLEGGHGALACASGMAAVHMALVTALADRRKSVVAADAMYGATVNVLMKVLEPLGIAVRFVDICDLDALRIAVAEAKPGCIVMETISNPLLRVGQVDRIAEIARQAGAALVVDNTFGTPLLCRPLEMGAHFSVHSLTKYLAGHGDVLGGIVDLRPAEHYEGLRTLSRIVGPVLGPFESYLTMRGIKTLCTAHGAAVRQCLPRGRLAGVASSGGARPLHRRPGASRCRHHPRACSRKNLYGAMVAFEI